MFTSEKVLLARQLVANRMARKKWLPTGISVRFFVGGNSFCKILDEANVFSNTESAKISHGLVRVEISLGVTIFHA